jgi:hypothetical protein
MANWPYGLCFFKRTNINDVFKSRRDIRKMTL